MKHRGLGAGFTVVEVTIVLAVSSALLVSAIASFRGQAGRTEFATTVRDFDSRLQDIINDVSTGYYPNTGVACSGGGSSEIILASGSANNLGTNGSCTFIGKVILFTPNAQLSSFRVFTAAGKRLKDTTLQPVDLQEAAPHLIAPGTPPYATVPDSSETINLGGGVKINSVNYNPTAAATTSDPSSYAIGFISTFGSYNGNALSSGSNSLELRAIPKFGTSPLDNVFIAPSNADPVRFVTTMNTNLRNPVVSSVITTGTVTICLNSQSSDQSGVITIYGASRQLKLDSVIKNGPCT